MKAASMDATLRFPMVAVLVLLGAAPASAADHPAVAREMAGVWLPDGRNSGRLPQQWPMKAEAQRAADNYQQQYGPIDPRIDDANTSCLPEPHPYSMRLIAQYPMEILFTSGQVTFFFEVYGGIRRVYLDERRRSDDVLPSVMGHSIGHWEGDTLVIETTRIRKEGVGRFSGNPPSSAARRIVERISLGKDGEGRRQLRNDMTIEDPVVLTSPVTIRMLYKWSPDIEVGEYLCQQDIWDQNLQGSPSSVPWRQ
jgi:hypothetical protein